jgi:hypothetical protein
MPCVPAWPASVGGGFAFLSGFKDRLIALDVEGETVIIAAEASEGEFEEFLPKAQEVLDTVEWGNR